MRKTINRWLCVSRFLVAIHSDIKFIVNEAAKLALTRNSSISTTDFGEILQNTAPSVSFEKIEKYESFKNI